MSFRQVLNGLRTVASVILYLFFGFLVLASFVETGPRYVLGAIVLVIVVLGLTVSTYENWKLRRARNEYSELQRQHGSDAREYCPHRILELSQRDIGVIVMTDKWCKICGQHLGPATLKESFFGNKWV